MFSRGRVLGVHRDVADQRPASDGGRGLLASVEQLFVQSNYWYAHDADPLFMHPPDWMRIVTGLSAFVLHAVLTIVLVTALLTPGTGSSCRR